MRVSSRELNKRCEQSKALVKKIEQGDHSKEVVLEIIGLCDYINDMRKFLNLPRVDKDMSHLSQEKAIEEFGRVLSEQCGDMFCNGAHCILDGLNNTPLCFWIVRLKGAWEKADYDSLLALRDICAGEVEGS